MRSVIRFLGLLLLVVFILGCLGEDEEEKRMSIPTIDFGDFVREWGTDIHSNTSTFAPGNIELTSGGLLLVADVLNHRILILDNSLNYQGSFGTFGDGDGEMKYPQGVYCYSSYYYVVDTRNSRITRFNTTDNSFDATLVTAGDANGQVSEPMDIAFDADKFYVADTLNGRVQRFAADGTFDAVINDSGTPLSAPQSVAVHSATGNIYVTDGPNHRVVRFASDGTKLSEFGSSELRKPYGIDVYDDGTNVYIFVADFENHCVRRYAPNGSLLATWGTYGTASGQLRYPTGIAVDSTNGWVFVGDSDNCRIQKFDLNGNLLATFGGLVLPNGELNRPMGIAFYEEGGNKYVAVCDTFNHRIQIFETDGTFVRTFGSFGYADGQFYGPEGVAVDAANNRIYVADTGNHRIQVFDLNGTHIATWGYYDSGAGKYVPSPEDDGFYHPMGIHLHSTNGYLYVADCYNHRIKVINATDGSYIESWGLYDSGTGYYYPGSGEGEFDYPTDVTQDSAGNILVADSANRRVQHFTAGGIYKDQYNCYGLLVSPYSVCVCDDAAGYEMLYILDTDSCAVVIVDLDHKKPIGAYGGFGYGNKKFYLPKGMDCDPVTGYLYICDTYNCRIAVVGTR